jgi:carbonic anhydrase/acetyltransferase-like protein (isoleucine patch superfamily)
MRSFTGLLRTWSLVASHAIILPGAIIRIIGVVSVGSAVNGISPSGQLISGNPAKVANQSILARHKATRAKEFHSGLFVLRNVL